MLGLVLKSHLTDKNEDYGTDQALLFDYVLNRLEVVNERVLEEGKGFNIRLGLIDVADQISLKIDEIFEGEN